MNRTFQKIVVGVAITVTSALAIGGGAFVRDVVGKLEKIAAVQTAQGVKLLEREADLKASAATTQIVKSHEALLEQHQGMIQARVTHSEFNAERAEHQKWSSQVIQRLEERNTATDKRLERLELKIDRLIELERSNGIR